MHVQWQERVDIEGVLDDRQGATRVFTIDLEDHPDTRGETADLARAGLDHLEPRAGHGRVDRHRRISLLVSSEQGCIVKTGTPVVNIE